MNTDARITPLGHLELTLGDQVFSLGRVRGRDGMNGRNGKDGAPGPVGPQGPRGEPGERGAQGARGATGERGPQGERGPAGAPGRDGGIGPVGPQGTPGQRGAKGDKGDQGELGPIPRYQYDESHTRIRFEAKRAKNGGVAKWGEWIYLGSKMIKPTGAIATGHGTLLQERDIIRLIERYAAVPALEGYTQVHEDLTGTVDYIGYNKPNSGQWYIRKIDHSVDPSVHTFVTLDSSGGTDYATAWSGRTGLTYESLQDVAL